MMHEFATNPARFGYGQPCAGLMRANGFVGSNQGLGLLPHLNRTELQGPIAALENQLLGFRPQTAIRVSPRNEAQHFGVG